MQHKNQKKISHFVGLSGIGGVQSNFVEYMKNIELYPSGFNHKIYTIGKVDAHYQLANKVFDIRKVKNLYRLILDIISEDTVVHFYNNLSSYKVALLLAILPVKKLIVHERGTIWNQSSANWIIPSFIAWKASIVLSNSLATKKMLLKKILISKRKILILHNGVNTSINHNYSSLKTNERIFHIGFIGRLESPKGVHILIDAMYHLRNENIKLIIAGEGSLGNILRNSAYNLNNIEFVGRVKKPFVFLEKIDMLVVPSIREPLGNVCLEAGLSKTPVLATNVDGIPEIIENKVTGELINPTDDILINIPNDSIPFPELVFNPIDKHICPPKQINPYVLAKKILELSEKPDLLQQYSQGLYNKVIMHFSIEIYRKKLHVIYRELFL